MSVLLVALEPAPQVDTTIQFKDELLDSIIEARMKGMWLCFAYKIYYWL